MIAETRQRLSLSRDADSRRRVQTFDFDDGQGHVAVENGVLRPVDALASAFAEELADPVTAVGKGGRTARSSRRRLGPRRGDGGMARLSRPRSRQAPLGGGQEALSVDIIRVQSNNVLGQLADGRPVAQGDRVANLI